MVFERKNKSFPFLDEELLEGLLKANTSFWLQIRFFITSNEWEKLNIKWEAIALFITDVLNCTQKIIFQYLAPRFVVMKNKIQNMSKVRKLKENSNFWMSYLFCQSQFSGKYEFCF